MAMLIPLLLMIVLFYFLLIRPQQKRQKEVNAMQSGLSKGDKIITIGGLHGTVVAIEDGNVVLDCAGSELTFDRNAVRTVLAKSDAVEEEVVEAEVEEVTTTEVDTEKK
ncbi:preprotein translocase subunit YajC [Listeria newyorkensis]|uniref:Preprotein translocase subunit YajC n=1 Tax=Listeria newyorkensis TaxID=1497681 RepID=A0A841YUG1_9LIST|nr:MULTISPECIES: preprotein translocase subunit YajC [Listeria]KGL38519.1 preprotein translocase subunit YajC [Listeriaceae bacterium FSL A5-0209]KGL45952.1 preprotein translocase subunit YajC [Listeria newyorkensis]KMT59389.1 preprotein translocase subunit YajC [Listeria newyorkensis]MBC1456602.1 preprotein translocase subunit YajC [Listeria newyorkensis]PNP90506.1 preprotein translocase subunit YajC [Listeria newyorkensis]